MVAFIKAITAMVGSKGFVVKTTEADLEIFLASIRGVGNFDVVDVDRYVPLAERKGKDL